MWNDQMQHLCDGCGKEMQAADIAHSSSYDLCHDCCDIENADEIMRSDGECAECRKWTTVEISSRLCGICLKKRELDLNT